MMATRLVVSLACVLVASAAVAEENANPVQKVISMMNDMMAKAKQEKQDEKVRFASFSQFCKSTTQQKKRLSNREMMTLRKQALRLIRLPLMSRRMQRRSQVTRRISAHGVQRRKIQSSFAQRRKQLMTKLMQRLWTILILLKRRKQLWRRATKIKPRQLCCN